MTRDQKIARIQELVKQKPPSDAELDAGLDALLAELEGAAKGPERPVKGILGALIIGGLIGHVIKK